MCLDAVDRSCESGRYDCREMAVSAAPSVGLASVVRLGAASSEFTSFCLCHSSGSVPAASMYLRLNLSHDDRCLAHVLLAHRFIDRLLGVRGRGVSSVLLWASSVHTFGLKDPIHIVGLSDAGIVESVDQVKPRRIHRRGHRGLVLELPVLIDPPSLGSRVIALPCGSCPEPSYFVQRRSAISAMRPRA